MARSRQQLELFLPVVIDLADGIADKEWNSLIAAKHHIKEITPRADGRVDHQFPPSSASLEALTGTGSGFGFGFRDSRKS